jgi:hypothetical protein
MMNYSEEVIAALRPLAGPKTVHHREGTTEEDNMNLMSIVNLPIHIN